MPAWLIRLGLFIAGEMIGENGLKKLAGLVAAVIILLLAVVLSLPALVVHIPLVTAESIGDFFEAAGELSEKTRTEDHPQGIIIPWDEVTAAWAVLHEQDFSRADATGVRELMWHWAERHERVEVYNDEQGNVRTETHIRYSLRDLNEVMDVLGFTREQKEMARRYLEALREGGVKPLAGWRARPALNWAWPVPGYDTAEVITSPYGFRIHPFTNRPEYIWEWILLRRRG
ncbi:MAG: hypothetical protein ACYC2T_14885 [Bacillota bacterium]